MLLVCFCAVSFSFFCCCLLIYFYHVSASYFAYRCCIAVNRSKACMLRVVRATEGRSLTSLPFKTHLPHHTASYAVSWVHLGSRKWDWEGEWEWGGGGEAGGRVSDLWAGSSGPGCTYFACWEPIKRWRWAHALHCGKACDTLVFFCNWWFVSVSFGVLVGGYRPFLGARCFD